MVEEKTKKERPKLRINIFIAGLMVMIALIYDGTQNLIDLLSLGFLGWLINPLISFWSLLTFFTWFSLMGVSYSKPGKILATGGTYILEFLPFLNDLPAITINVIMILTMTYAEDVVAKFSEQGARALSKVLSGPKVGKLAKDIAT